MTATGLSEVRKRKDLIELDISSSQGFFRKRMKETTYELESTRNGQAVRCPFCGKEVV